MDAEKTGLQLLRDSLNVLADKVPCYSAELRRAGFMACHVNDDWIASCCNATDLALHKRYLIEYAAEVLTSDDPFAILSRDSYVCKSSWLQQFKVDRLRSFGPADELSRRPESRHLIELSPGWRELVRVRESHAPEDREQVSDQMAAFVRHRAREVVVHGEAIGRCLATLPSVRDERSLQAFFATQLVHSLSSFGACAVTTLRRNQALRRDEQIVAVAFDVGKVFRFVLTPSVIGSGLVAAGGLAGTLGVGFRLMTPAALVAPKFEFGRDTVLHLYELLPGRFNDYGRFDEPEEFCLNVVAWTAALRIVLPDVLHILRTESALPSSLPPH